MKKLYTIASFVLVSAISFAQVTDASFPSPTDVSTKTLKSNKIYSSYAEKATPFWTEDFANGIPTTWTNGNTPTPPVISAPWVYRGPSTTPGVNTGSQGAYAGTNGPIASPTAANGFMLFDSDYYDNGGTAGNFGAGTYPCNSITGGAPTGHVGTLTTDSIDCSMYPDISILFHSFYREYTGIAKIAFSIDGGLTFTDTVEVHPNIEVNERTENDYQVMVRMPFNIAGNSNVKIQFIYDGTILYNTSYNGYYFWMIDDIELIETPAYLMTVVDANFGGWNTTPFSDGFGMDYTYMPLNQSAVSPYKFEATIANSGANTLNNVVLNAEVIDDAGSSVFTSTSTATNINTMDTLVTKTNNDFTPSSTGIYEFAYWGISDSILASDTTYKVSVATDTVYGRDMNNPGSSTWRVGRSCGGMQLGNVFDVFVADELTSVSAYVAGYSVPGSNMFAVLYEVDTAGGAMDFIYLDQTDDYTITSADTNNWVHIGFNGGYSLVASQYMIAIGGYANPIDTFGIVTSGDAPVSMSRIQDNGCNIGNQSFGYWYWISSTPMIRMNFGDVSVSVENVFSGKLSVYPNPSEGVFNLDLVNVNSGDYLISVSNILGEVVYSENRDVNSSTSATLDLSDMKSGVYMLNIQNDNNIISRKLIIE
jgi:hypothetical protein